MNMLKIEQQPKSGAASYIWSFPMDYTDIMFVIFSNKNGDALGSHACPATLDGLDVWCENVDGTWFWCWENDTSD